MILLVLLWLWSNEDLLNLGFHELLMVELLIQPIPLELKASIPSCVVCTSRSISFPPIHTILQVLGLNRCVWTLRYAHHQQLTHPPLNQELHLWNNLHCLLNHLDCWNLASYHRHSDLRTKYKHFWTGFCSVSCATFVHARTRQFGLIANLIENQLANHARSINVSVFMT